MARRQRRRLRERHGAPRRLAPREHERPTRSIDNTSHGEACRELRLAKPVTPATVDELERLGIDGARRAQARRWRRCLYLFDYVAERLEAVRLIEREYVTFELFPWGGRHGDEAIRLLSDREAGRAVLAAVCTPSARKQLSWAWDSLHEYADGPVPGDDYWWREGPLGTLREGLWFTGWLNAL